MRISEDGERLETGGFYMSKFYDESKVVELNLTFSQSDYKSQLSSNYNSKKEIPATLTYGDKVLEEVGVRYRGNTSYRRGGDKKSFSIDLEFVTKGQDINGYNELKLNNWVEDTSSMREVFYSNMARKNIPSTRGNFVNLTINGQNQGIFSNIQKLEKDHAKEWFFDGDATRWRAERTGGGGGFGGGFGGGGFGGAFGAGTSSMNDLGTNGSDYEDAYTLKKAYKDNPWQDLANACHTLGVTSRDRVIEEAGKLLDIDAALWFLATENIFDDDDGYVNKGGMDYYVYFDVASGRVLPIEYDGNSVLNGHNYNPFKNANSSSFPLLNILLNIPELRQRYLAHYRTVLEESLKPEVTTPVIDGYFALIDPYQAKDAPRHTSYNQFKSGVPDLKNKISSRYNSLMGNNEIKQTGLTIGNVNDAVNGKTSVRPTADQTVTVTAEVSGNKGVNAVYLYYSNVLAGTFTKVDMSNAGGNTYKADIPPQDKGAFVRYYIEAIANDSAKTATYEPVGAEHDVFIYQVISAESASSSVVINEAMPANKTTVATNDGKFSDWIELFNNSDQAIDLTGYYLTDEENTLDRWAFPSGTTIGAKSTLTIWADDKPELTDGLHANFKLSAGGENIYLVTPDMKFADQLSYTDAEDDASFARLPNGTGNFTWSSSPTYNQPNQ